MDPEFLVQGRQLQVLVDSPFLHLLSTEHPCQVVTVAFSGTKQWITGRGRAVDRSQLHYDPAPSASG